MRYARVACAILLCLSAAAYAGGAKKKSADSGQKQPEWLNNPETLFLSDAYITGIGSAKSRGDAENDAAAAIGRVLNQNIEAEENTQMSFSSASEGVSSYLSRIKTSTSLNDLAGISVKRSYSAPDGTEYALAVLNRNESGQYYRSKIEENNAAVKELLLLAEKTEGTFESCAYAVNAYELAKTNDYYFSLLAIIKPVYKKTVSVDYGSTNAVAQRTAELLSKINVSISVDGDTDGRVAAAFASALSSFGIKALAKQADKKVSDTTNVLYELTASVSYENIQMPDSKYAFVRYNVTSTTTDMSSGKNIFPWTKNARVGKLTEQDALNAATRALETAIINEYPQEFASAVFSKAK
ncbi:LPP20 family lipoprotein [Treponema parvum]|uniref:LPP20 family lipoprotein n=1 Tax=Treponema parvum TaxID=138851 RepID=UPI001AEC169B|nr:LPP20 family lipoprotein [Treponema parvum]QTQ16016.1 LPP20 family lipoprotein [Treponema parvum]